MSNAIALINNVASNKVIEKCGFIYKSQQRIENQIYNHYILRKSEWIKYNVLVKRPIAIGLFSFI